ALGSSSKVSLGPNASPKTGKKRGVLVAGLLVLAILGGLGAYFLEDLRKATDRAAVANNSGRQEKIENPLSKKSPEVKPEPKTEIVPEPTVEAKTEPQP